MDSLIEIGSVKEFEFLRHSARLLKKTYFALYQVYIEVRTKKFVDNPRQCFAFTPCVQLSQNSNVDNILPDRDKVPPRPFKILRTLLI